MFPCPNSERCTDTLGSFRCDPCLEDSCDGVGFQCDTWCHNGATCVINDYDDNDIDCLCTEGFTGANRGPFIFTVVVRDVSIAGLMSLVQMGLSVYLIIELRLF